MTSLQQLYEALAAAEEADIEATLLEADIREYKIGTHRAVIQCKENVAAHSLALRNPMPVPQKKLEAAFA